MTDLLLRADGGPGIGLGHLSRCVAFAEEGVRRGWRVRLAGEVGSDWVRDRLAELGVAVLAPGWQAADVVVVDHYGIDGVPPGPRVVSVEDGRFGRRRADVVVDSGLARSPRPDDGSGVVLAGPAYAPLRELVRDARASRVAGWHEPPRVLVVMGGGQVAGAVESVLAALAATGVPVEVSVVTSMPLSAPGVRVLPPRFDLPALFATADLVVSAAGVTLLELCCVGAPTAILCVADNQEPGYAAAVEQGVAVGVGSLNAFSVDAAAATLHGLLTLPDLRAGLTERAKAAVDGLGARRVLDLVDA